MQAMLANHPAALGHAAQAITSDLAAANMTLPKEESRPTVGKAT
jgi:hypothetical protein